MRRPYLAALLVTAFISFTARGFAWGPHPEITRAALSVLPNLQEVEAKLGESNIKALATYCLLPDLRGRDMGDYFADDYLLIPAMPRHVGHTMPAVADAFEPYFQRALLALRTESPKNACRQLGPLVHFIEDVGAPPHAKENCPHHGELENWVKGELINIQGYQPLILGETDKQALAGLKQRVAELVAFSKERAERALPLVSAPQPDRSQVEPILLESANESARVTADVLYTVFMLGLKEGSAPGQAILEGRIIAPAAPGNDDQSPRVALLGTDFSTLGESDVSDGSKSHFIFHHLPDGTYRVLVYRIAGKPWTSTVELKASQPVKLDVELAPTDPPGNLVYNPDGQLRILDAKMPERWSVTAAGARKVWTSTVIPLRGGQHYQCGVDLKDADARVRFVRPPTRNDQVGRVVFLATGAGRHVGEFIAERGDATLLVQIETVRDLTDAIENVWVVLVPSDKDG